MLHSALPTFFLRHWFYRPAAGTLPFEIGSGSGSHTHLKKFMRLLSVHWSSFPQLKLVESVGNAPTSTCLQSRCIACLPRPQKEFMTYDFGFADLRFGRPPRCCPEQAEFWKLCCTAGARPV